MFGTPHRVFIDLDDGLFQISEFQHVKPGKGGAFVRTTLKNVRTGAVIERTFRAGEKMERAVIDKREMQYLYSDGGDLVFMDSETYEQIQVSRQQLGDAPNYLVEGNAAVLQMYGSEIVGTELPASVVLAVKDVVKVAKSQRPRDWNETSPPCLITESPLIFDAACLPPHSCRARRFVPCCDRR